MGYWLFFAFHLFSLGLCIVATLSTVRYLEKHRVAPKVRYMPFGKLRTRHVAVFYVLSILILTLYSLIRGVYYL